MRRAQSMIRPRIAGAARRFSSAAARVAQYEPPQVELLSCIAPPTLSRLLAIENEAFPPCERLGSVLLPQTALQRNNGLLVAHAEEDFAGYLLFSRTAEESIIMKLAVEAAHRGCGVGSMLLRRAIEELEQPTRRGDARPIVLHVDPSRDAARRLYSGAGFADVELLPRYYADERDAILMRRPPPPDAKRHRDDEPAEHAQRLGVNVQ